MPDADRGARRHGFWQTLLAGCGTRADRRNQVRFVGWCALWALGLLAATALLQSESPPSGALAWLVAAVPIALSAGALLSYLRFLRNADELTRKIQVEGLAIGFGAGILLTLGYRVLERAGAPEMSSHDVVLIMVAGWIAGEILAALHYR